MRKKPSGKKYRNLFARRDVIYYERRWKGERYKASTQTSDWETAIAFRDEYERQEGIGIDATILTIPTFQEFSQDYMASGMVDLARSTREERVRELRADGPTMSFFREYRLDDITSGVLRRFWIAAVDNRGRSRKTGKNYLDVVSGVLSFAVELETIAENPVHSFRTALNSRQTKRNRRAARRDRNIRPIEDPEHIDRLVEAIEREGSRAVLYVLLMLDAGLRSGEALGLRWCDIEWGDGPDGRRRALQVCNNRPRGAYDDIPKNGLDRRVDLSKRLWLKLADEFQRTPPRSLETLVLCGLDPSNFRKREWRRALNQAEIGRWRFKDLRDTYASQLLTSGISLGYVSFQIGHSDVSTTSAFYAKWIEETTYREPARLAPDEVPADILARLGSHQSPTTQESDDADDHITIRNLWRAGRDSNPRPSGSKKNPNPRKINDLRSSDRHIAA